MNRRRALAWIVAAIAAPAMVVSAWFMTGRVAEFHRLKKREIFAFQPVVTREFQYSGRPVTISDEGTDSALSVVIRYGGEELRLHPTLKSDVRLPGLLAHEDWLRVLRFAAATGTTLDRLQARMESGEVRDRLVVVTRTPEPGADPSSWGEVNQRAWTFDFYEFLPGGGFDHQHKRFPVKRRADLRTGQVPAAPEDELKENTWQFQAALMVMPPARGPSPQFTDDGLHAMGWTLPATSISMLALIGAVIVGATPERSRLGRGAA